MSTWLGYSKGLFNQTLAYMQSEGILKTGWHLQSMDFKERRLLLLCGWALPNQLKALKGELIFLGEEGIFLQGCNIETPPEFPPCWPSLQILNLPVLQIVWVNFLKISLSLSLCLEKEKKKSIFISIPMYTYQHFLEVLFLWRALIGTKPMT